RQTAPASPASQRPPARKVLPEPRPRRSCRSLRFDKPVEIAARLIEGVQHSGQYIGAMYKILFAAEFRRMMDHPADAGDGEDQSRHLPADRNGVMAADGFKLQRLQPATRG